jgi:hypothetical protein
MAVSARSAKIRVIAALAAFCFCLQTGRFFIGASVNPSICPLDSYGSSSVGGEHDPDEAALSLPRDHDSGFYFQHCKDTVDGLALTPVQPLPMPTVAAEQEPVAIRVRISCENQRAAGIELPPPFQPPRYSYQSYFFQS